MAFKSAPPQGIAAMKAKPGSQFVGVLKEREIVQEGKFEDPETGKPRPDYFYTFEVQKSNFDGMEVGKDYHFAAPTRMWRQIESFKNVKAGDVFQITFLGIDTQQGKAANFLVERDE